ncbi:TIR domain-containing protein [candidate division WOR-3 bacterium]|uniref:TIR domain-containing protein n=1 Tax=candidate division WOR-3 bacterium TaxID=2052148 RepID=A0A938BUW8_UNCW3|nr:TIR domain-containing protein [candidate division WOR-3 bacterium]
MKVFISWSGELSKSLALALSKWLKTAIQACDPYFSPDDIAKGSRWANEVSSELDASGFGILCLTKDNLDAPWIMFEAGALSKHVEVAHVCPILFDVERTKIKGPLEQFQFTVFDQQDMRRLLLSVNEALGDDALEDDVLNRVFEQWWPVLEQSVSSILSSHKPADHSPLRNTDEMVAETLERVRSLEGQVARLAVPTLAAGEAVTSRALLDAARKRLVRQAHSTLCLGAADAAKMGEVTAALTAAGFSGLPCALLPSNKHYHIKLAALDDSSRTICLEVARKLVANAKLM